MSVKKVNKTTGATTKVAGLVNSEKVNTMYGAFPSDASASNKLVSDATADEKISDAIADKADKVSSATNGNFAGLDASGNLTDSGKKPSDFQTALTFDDAPTENSNNPVKSGGVYAIEHSLAEKIDKVGNVSGDAETIAYTDMVSIEDALAVNAKDVSIKIEPVQAGSGTPSPDNIRAISGWSSAKVVRAGKNKLPLKMSSLKSMNSSGTWSRNVYTKDGLTFSAETNDGENVNAITINGLASERVVLYLNSRFSPSSGQYTLSKTANTSSVSMVASAYNNTTWVKTLTQFSSGVGTFTIDYDGYDRIEIYIVIQSGTTISNVKLYPQLELGSTATAFEPYTSNEYTIDLGDTIYGGTLDVTSGKLTVDRAYDTISGFTGYNTGDKWVYIGTDGAASSSVTKMVADSLETKDIDSLRSSYDGVSVNSQGILLVKNSAITNQSLEGYNEYYTANPLHVVYELATPQVIQLTPTQIRMLAGINTMYANTGDTQVEYFNASVGNLGEVVGDVQEETQTLTNKVKGNWSEGGKNLLKNTASSATVNGITFTVNDDGSVTVNGTATAISVFYIATGTWDSPKDIILSGCPSGGSVDTYALELALYGQYDTGNGLEKSGVTIYNTRIRIANGYTASNLTFYPMIRLASIEDDTYEPYAKTNQQLTQDTTALLDNLEVNGAVNILPIDLNLIKANNSASSWSGNACTHNGVTYTIDEANGKITVNGTASARSTLQVYNAIAGDLFKKGFKYLAKVFNNDFNVVNGYYVQLYMTNSPYTRIDTFTGNNFVVPDSFFGNSIRVSIQIVVENGKSVDNQVITPLIAFGNYTGGFEKYAKSNRELTEDSIPVDIKSTLTSSYGTFSVTFAYKVGKIVSASGTLTLTSDATAWSKIMTMEISGKSFLDQFAFVAGLDYNNKVIVPLQVGKDTGGKLKIESMGSIASGVILKFSFTAVLA